MNSSQILLSTLNPKTSKSTFNSSKLFVMPILYNRALIILLPVANTSASGYF